MLTKDQLSRLYPKAQQDTLNAFAEQADSLLAKYGISANNNRLSYFLAQVGHESGGLSITVENLNYRAERLMVVWPKRFPNLAAATPYAGNPEKLGNFVYANRMGNGPPASGEGFKYRGRGLIQITGKDAYQQLGKAANVDLLGNPDQAYAPETALGIACEFWSWKKLNPVCDKKDFKKVTYLINGGFNGLEDREAWLDKVRRILLATSQPSLPDPLPTGVVIAVQQALRTKGYTEVGAADGLIGPRTKAAITHFRQRTGLPVNDSIDLALLHALGVTV